MPVTSKMRKKNQQRITDYVETFLVTGTVDETCDLEFFLDWVSLNQNQSLSQQPTNTFPFKI